MVFPSFPFATRLNSQNRIETEFINEHWHLFFTWILVYPFGIIEDSSPRNEVFHLFQIVIWLRSFKYLKLFSTYLVGRKGAMGKTCFSAPQNGKMKISLNIKTKSVTEFLTVRSLSMKDYTCHYEVSTYKT
jgi:hypothetical protein